MRIGLVGYLFGQGGIQTHTQHLAEKLVDLGDDVVVYTPPQFEHHPGTLPVKRRYKIVEYSTLSVLTGFGLPKLDIIVVTGVGWKAMSIALLANRSAKKVFFEVMSGKRHGWLDPRMLVHAGFDAVVAQGTPVERRFREAFRWTGSSCTIPALGLPLHLDTVPDAGYRTNSSSQDPIRFAYFGRLAAHKNVVFLIENWHEFAPEGATMDIWGIGDQETRLRDVIQSMGLQDKISLKGRYPNGQAYLNLLSEYDLKLLPTVGDEGAPLVLLEAMASGLPFVANGVGGILDYANPDCEITSGDIDEFIPMTKKMIDRLTCSDINYDRLRQHYQDNFSTERLAERWHMFLHNLSTRE